MHLYTPPFCPNQWCRNHLKPRSVRWFVRDGFHATRTFGKVLRFSCRACGKSFSAQTFSIDYFAKRRLDYKDILLRHAASESLRGMSRALGASCASVQNRLERLSRQAAALHSKLRPRALRDEAVCVDGFVSFDVSQYFPSEITIATTADSRFILDLSHASRRRSGALTEEQRRRSAEVYQRAHLERGAVRRSFSDVLSTLEAERSPQPGRPLVLITDEKWDYREVLARSRAWREQDESRRVVHVTVSAKHPRTYRNPLFASNYLDREIRKDQANHRRETTCYSRNVANGMCRLMCYFFYRNYMKRFRIKSRRGDERVHAEVAGIPRGEIDVAIRLFFTTRLFHSRARLTGFLARIWKKDISTPLKTKAEYLPAFARE